MWCAACGCPGSKSPCRACARRLHPAPDRIVGPPGRASLAVRAAYLHEGTARVLVHELKYHGSRRAGRLLAGAMAEQLGEVDLLVPIPRAWARRWKYGIDQAVLLAETVGALTGTPVHRGLLPPLWQPPHAGTSRRGRTPVSFRLRRPAPEGRIALIDDVVTTGATVWSAAAALGFRTRMALAATSADEVTSLCR